MTKPILIAAGGTGGHIFPALAVADYLRDQGVPLLWLGTARGLEAKLVPQAGYRLLTVQVGGIRRKGWMALALAPMRIGRALLQSMYLLLRWRPRAVLGMGGFVSGPAGVAAWLLRIPLLMHEQNAVAGFTNTVLARFANRVLEAFPGTIKRPGVIWTGNPVRRSIAALPEPEVRFAQRVSHRRRLMIFGGSQGAQVLNDVLPPAIARSHFRDIEIWHQTGRDRAEATREAYRKLGIEARIEPFIDDMASAYAWADLVVCRSGALTIAELAAAGVGAVLVPFAGAVDDHQTVNAKFLTEVGAAVMLPQPELDPDRLARVLDELMSSEELLMDMARKARSRARAEATADVANQCLEMSRGHG